ncbi:MAG: hypothetical protein E7515_03445 [Ruminococcaceae bacterium]|nr:hypothetical protein [Oscillospiraceae bacterium]
MKELFGKLLKNKKVFISVTSALLVLIITVIAVSVGVSKTDKSEKGDNTPTESFSTTQTTTETTQTTTQLTIQTTTQSTTHNTTQNVTVPIEWEDLEYEYVDSSGYKFEISLSLSPWILLSNQNAINSAWAKVGNNNTLPGFNDWGLEKWETYNTYNRSGMIKALNGYSTSYFRKPMTDMYYCMASLKIKNVTEGWDIDTSNSRNVGFSLLWKADRMDIDCIGRIFYSNGEKDYLTGVNINADMVGNDWGPVSIVFMAPENMTPNNPNGDYYSDLLNLTHLETFALNAGIKKTIWNGEEVSYPTVPYVGIIGNDGKYVKSNRE